MPAIAAVKRGLKQLGVDVRVGTRAEGFEAEGSGVLVKLSGETGIPADRILLAVGRRPNTADLGLEAAAVETDERGFVVADDSLRTTNERVFAIGDLVPGPMLAHKASAEGVALADSFAGEAIALDYDRIPQAIFTEPEVASVGLSEARAKERGAPILVGRFPYAALGKALGMREPDGFFQIVADASDHRILGAQIVGAEASDLISEAAVAVSNGLTLEAVIETVHPHPTLPEGFREACEDALGRAIHTAKR